MNVPNIPKIKARYEAAIPSPWTLRREEPDVDVMSGKTVIAAMGDFYPEAEFVSHARTDIPALVTALEEVRELLHQRPDGPWDDSGTLDPSMSAEEWEEKVAAILGESE